MDRAIRPALDDGARKANFLDSLVLTSSRHAELDTLQGSARDEMETVDLEVVSVLIYQQWLEATEHAHWDEAAMALYKLQEIADGEPFTDLVIQ